MSEEKEKKKSKKQTGTIAKKDFLIVQNDYRCTIKEGDDIEELGVPKRFFDNLKTEGVI